MSWTLGKGNVDLTASDGNLQRVFRRVEGRLTKMRASLAAVAAKVKWAFLGGVAASGYAVKVAADMDEMRSKFVAVFKDQSKAVEEWSATLAAEVNRSKFTIMDGVSVFQSFFAGMDFSSEKAAELSKQMEVLSVDFGSFHNLADQDTLQRFISALSGSAEVLARFGVNLKAGATNEYLLSRGISKTVQQLSEQEKITTRVAMIMESMGKQGAMGDAARTSESFSNRLKGLMGTLAEFADVVGGALIPGLQRVLGVFLDVLRPLVKWIEANKELTATVIGTTLALGGLAIILPKIISLGMGLSKMFAILTAHPIVALISLIALLIVKFVNMERVIQAFQVMWESVWAAIRPIVIAFGTTFGGVFSFIADIVGKVAGWIQTALVNAFLAISFTVDNFSNIMKLAFVSIQFAALAWFNDTVHFLTYIPRMLVWMAENWRSVLTNIWEYTTTVFSNMADNIGAFFSSVGKWITGGDWEYAWKPLTDGFRKTMLTELPTLLRKGMTQTERDLLSRVSSLKAKLGRSWEDKKQECADKMAVVKTEEMEESKMGVSSSSKKGRAALEKKQKTDQRKLKFMGGDDMWKKLASLNKQDPAKQQLAEQKKQSTAQKAQLSEQKRSTKVLKQISSKLDAGDGALASVGA